MAELLVTFTVIVILAALAFLSLRMIRAKADMTVSNMKALGKTLAGIVATVSLATAEEKAAKPDAAVAAGEAAGIKFEGSRAGEEREFEIAPGVTMKFCCCPAGEAGMYPGGSLDEVAWHTAQMMPWNAPPGSRLNWTHTPVASLASHVVGDDSRKALETLLRINEI